MNSRKIRINRYLIIGLVMSLLFVVGLIIAASSLIGVLIEKSRLEDLGSTVTLKFTWLYWLLIIATFVSGIVGLISVFKAKKENDIASDIPKVIETPSTKTKLVSAPDPKSVLKVEYETESKSEIKSEPEYKFEPKPIKTAETVSTPVNTSSPASGTSKLKINMGKSSMDNSSVPVSSGKEEKSDPTSEFFKIGDDL